MCDLTKMLNWIKLDPHSLTGSKDYDTAVAFINGVDFALNGGLLRGYGEWLQMKMSRESLLVWSGLVVSVYFPNEGRLLNRETRTGADNKRLLTKMVESLLEFLHERERNGLCPIFVRYDEWKRRHRGDESARGSDAPWRIQPDEENQRKP